MRRRDLFVRASKSVPHGAVRVSLLHVSRDVVAERMGFFRDSNPVTIAIINPRGKWICKEPWTPTFRHVLRFTRVAPYGRKIVASWEGKRPSSIVKFKLKANRPGARKEEG